MHGVPEGYNIGSVFPNAQGLTRCPSYNEGILAWFQLFSCDPGGTKSPHSVPSMANSAIWLTREADAAVADGASRDDSSAVAVAGFHLVPNACRATRLLQNVQRPVRHEPLRGGA